MASITKLTNSFTVAIGNRTYVHPLGSMIAIRSECAETVDLKDIASRKTIHSLKAVDVTVPECTDAEDLQTKLVEIMN